MQRTLVAAVLALCLASGARAFTWEATLTGENQVSFGCVVHKASTKRRPAEIVDPPQG